MEAAVAIATQPQENRPSYDVVVTAPGASVSESTVRDIVKRHRANLESIVTRGPQRAHLRMATTCVYDIIIALEAIGMDVVRVVATAR